MHMFLIFLVEKVPFFLHFDMEWLFGSLGSQIDGGLIGYLQDGSRLVEGKRGRVLGLSDEYVSGKVEFNLEP